MKFLFLTKRITDFHKTVIVRNMHLLKKQAYVNGCWVNAACNKTFEVKNPYNDSVVGTVPDMSADEVCQAVRCAYDAFNCWKETTAKERSILLRKWYNLMVQNAEEIAKIITLESGKPLAESRAEVNYGNSFIEWFSEQARNINGEIISSPMKSSKILLVKQPIGVTALITPWNFPHAMITRKAGAALAAGCTCVAKPASETPLTALALAQLAEEAGFPKGVFNVITCSHANTPAVGNMFCESPIVAGLSFTGSTAVGKLLYRQSAGTLKRLALELGGKGPFIIFKSADIDKAVQGAMVAKFRNCGQTCVAANKFLIEESIFDEFVCKFSRAMKDVVLGNGCDPKVTAGPLINEAQAQKVCNIVQDAVCKGAKVVLGGKSATKLGKLFFEPTLLTNIKEDMICFQEEIFGPVAPCISFKTEEEALRMANNTRGGLAGYFYSSDISQVFRVANLLEVGMVGINEGLISTTEAAFGGVKESGLGREGSHYGIDEYVNIKYLCLGNLS